MTPLRSPLCSCCEGQFSGRTRRHQSGYALHGAVSGAAPQLQFWSICKFVAISGPCRDCIFMAMQHDNEVALCFVSSAQRYQQL